MASESDRVLSTTPDLTSPVLNFDFPLPPSSPCLLSQKFLRLLNFISVIYIDLRFRSARSFRFVSQWWVTLFVDPRSSKQLLHILERIHLRFAPMQPQLSQYR